MTWLGYSRVSSVGGRDATLISPEQQRQRIAEYASARGYEVEMLEPELNVSGAKRSRPILDTAIARIEAGAEGIIVASLDRLSRMALSDALSVIERIESAGGQVVAVAENVDPSTASGRLARNVFLSMAEHQREQYRQHTIVSKRQAVERGIWPNPVVPRGYVKGEGRGLERGPDAPKVVLAFEMRARGASWATIADVLGCGQSGVAKTIRSRAYLGEIHLEIDGVAHINRNAHEPLVSRDLWEAAQISMPRPPREKTEPSLLAGLVRCGHCSQLMSPGDGVYRCFPRKVAGRCPSPPSIKASMLEEFVEDTVRELAAGIEGRAVPAEVGLEEMRALEVAEAELAEFQAATSASGVGAEHFASGLRSRAEAVEAASAALGRVRGAQMASQDGVDAIRSYDSLGVAERRQVLRGALGVVWVWKGRGLDRVKLIRAGMEPAMLSGPGVSVPLVEVSRGELPGEVSVPGGEHGTE